ncbi:MAG: hypothetical protein AAFP69_24010, partial [Planctomycetota bacterium]
QMQIQFCGRLEILARREDGYHELETVMVPVSLFDQMTLRFADYRAASARSEFKIDVACDWKASRVSPHQALEAARRQHPELAGNATGTLDRFLDLPQGEKNLVHTAIQQLLSRYADAGRLVPHRVECEIQKSIPSGAGMGGGSSNAAGALLASAAACDVPLSDPQIHSIAAAIGSDVNFFLGIGGRRIRAALATGRGEQLKRIRYGGKNWFVVIYPPDALSTGRVFAGSSVSERQRDANQICHWLGKSQRMQHQRDVPLHNQLESAAISLSPWIQEISNWMWHSGLLAVQLTGSGSACFGVARSFRQARSSAMQLSEKSLGRVFLVHSTRTPRPIRIV